MEEEEFPNAANSELRFITLELMRLAQKSGRSFEEVAREFVENTCRLQELVSGDVAPARRRRGGASARQK